MRKGNKLFSKKLLTFGEFAVTLLRIRAGKTLALTIYYSKITNSIKINIHYDY